MCANKEERCDTTYFYTVDKPARPTHTVPRLDRVNTADRERLVTRPVRGGHWPGRMRSRAGRARSSGSSDTDDTPGALTDRIA